MTDDPIDTNVIIRYLTNDHPDQSARALQLFRDLADGLTSARLTEAVLVETIQVLSSKTLYNLPRADIHRHLRMIISLRGVKLAGKRRYLRALDLYLATAALSFVDALLAAYALENPSPTVISFDTGFDRVAALIRREPR